MKVLLDLNVPPSLVQRLRERGVEAVHWSEVGDLRAPDHVLLQWARDRAHVVLTHDLDFGALLAMTRARGPSVMQVRVQDLASETMVTLVLDVLEKHAEVLERGAVISIEERSARVRILPLFESNP